jgi:hypothetical protein
MSSVQRINRSLKIGLAVLGLMSMQSCAAYMAVMGSIPVTGSINTINTTSVPICKITLYSVADPAVRYDNENKYKVLLAPGEEGTVSYPMGKTEQGGPTTPEKLAMRVYACKPGNFDQLDVGTQIANIENVDVKSESVVIR